MAFCFVVRDHYDHVAKAVQKLEADILPKLYTANPVEPGVRDPDAPTAVVLVSGFNGLGLATMLQIEELFPKQFRNIVFVGVGEVDSSQMRSHEQIETLESRMVDDLQSYCDLAAQLGFHAEQRAGLGPDVVLEIRLACSEVMNTFSRCVFFAGSLVFEDESEGTHRAISAQSHRLRNPAMVADSWPQPRHPASLRERRCDRTIDRIKKERASKG